MSGFAYYNNGLSFEAAESGWTLAAGKVFFATAPTTEELETAFPGYAAASAGVSLVQQAQAALNAGLAVTSTANGPALNGTYAVDPVTEAKITAVSLYIMKNGTFPGGGTTYTWPDISGTLHTFPSVAEFEAFATAVANYVSALDLIILSGSGTLPAASATIA